MDIISLSTKIAGQAADKALAAHGVPGGGAVTEAALREIIGAFVEIQDEQAAALRRIEAGVQRLIEQPWNTARAYLEEAAAPGRDRKGVLASLRRAAEYFREAAQTQDRDSFGRAYVCLDLALTLRLLGEDEPVVQLYARQAAAAADARMRALREQLVADQRGLRGRVRAVRERDRAALPFEVRRRLLWEFLPDPKDRGPKLALEHFPLLAWLRPRGGPALGWLTTWIVVVELHRCIEPERHYGWAHLAIDLAPEGVPAKQRAAFLEDAEGLDFDVLCERAHPDGFAEYRGIRGAARALGGAGADREPWLVTREDIASVVRLLSPAVDPKSRT